MKVLWIVAAILHCTTLVVSERQEVSTYDGNARGASCVFPHIWRGSTYNSCHHGPLGGKKWCCTVPNCGWLRAKQWGYCDEKRSTWNHLAVRFGKFYGLPLNENDAQSKGWRMIADDCQDRSGPFLGRRYSLNNNQATILIFDVKGHIAGTQMAFKNSSMNSLPIKYAEAYQTLGDSVYLTAYFTEPTKVCDKDAKQYSDVVGDELVFLTGRDKYLRAPLEIKNLQGTKWIKGRCFVGMGTHYWYDISAGMNCNDFFPFFLLYNMKGKLVAWGYTVLGVDVDSSTVEHPPTSLISLFFNKATSPTCASEISKLSTQHIYFTKVGFTTHLCPLW